MAFIHAVESFDCCFQTTAVHYQVLWGGGGQGSTKHEEIAEERDLGRRGRPYFKLATGT